MKSATRGFPFAAEFMEGSRRNYRQGEAGVNSGAEKRIRGGDPSTSAIRLFHRTGKSEIITAEALFGYRNKHRNWRF